MENDRLQKEQADSAVKTCIAILTTVVTMRKIPVISEGPVAFTVVISIIFI